MLEWQGQLRLQPGHWQLHFCRICQVSLFSGCLVSARQIKVPNYVTGTVCEDPPPSLLNFSCFKCSIAVLGRPGGTNHRSCYTGIHLSVCHQDGAAHEANCRHWLKWRNNVINESHKSYENISLKFYFASADWLKYVEGVVGKTGG